MTRKFSGIQKFLGELKRRHVTQVLIAYCVVAFAIMQVADTFFPALRLPDWSITVVATLLIIGLPICAALAWIFDLTPDGVQSTDTVASGAQPSARRLALLALVVVLAGTLGAFAVTRVSTAGPTINSLAVLPFDNMSGSKDNEYFADGITEDVLTQLSKLSGTKVISRTSVTQYKMNKKPVPQIANELKVGAVLEGSVRREGNRVRIVAQLIDANDKHLWAETYDRDISDIFVVQSEIAHEIADALRAELTPAKAAQLKRIAKQSIDPHAYEEYLRGLHHAAANRRDMSNEHLLKAIELQPAYAPAHAVLARNYYFQAFLTAKSPEEMMPKVFAAAQRALKLDDELADAHATLALYHMHYRYDFATAEREFKRALELAPANAQVRHEYAHLLVATGRSAESASETVRAGELDPANAMLQACVGWHRFADAHYQAAIDGANTALMMMPNAFWPELILGWGLQHSGKLPEAIVQFRKAVKSSKERPFAKAALAHALATAGERQEAQTILRELLSGADKKYVSPYDVAAVYAGLGERDKALQWLQKAFDEHASFVVFLNADPRFEPLRGEKAFAALAARLSSKTLAQQQ